MSNVRSLQPSSVRPKHRLNPYLVVSYSYDYLYTQSSTGCGHPHYDSQKACVLQIMAYLGCPDQELSVVFGNDRLLQELNRTYRHKDRPTNVLAFPQSPTYAGEPASTMLGDVIVSLPTAAREAR